MKFQKKLAVAVLTFCLTALGATAFAGPVYAKKITGMKQAAQLALQTVKNGDVVEVDKDYEKGTLVYEVQLIKGKKEYDITYRASDGKMLAYGWEEYRVSRGGKKTISKAKCCKLAAKEIPGGKILSLVKKYDDGIPVYKVKADKGGKRYTLKYHGKTGKLIEYEWKLTAVKGSGNVQGSGYIGMAKAKKIALAKAPKATVIKAEFDRDDGTPVYELELIRGMVEYEFKIHAKTGEILEMEKDYNGGW